MSYDTWLDQQAEKDAKKRYPDNADELEFLSDQIEYVDYATNILIDVRDALNKNKHYPEAYIDVDTAVDCCFNALKNLEDYYKYENEHR